MTTYRSLKRLICLLPLLLFMANARAGLTDISTVPLNTYSAPSSTDVKPNILFVLDNSGSMAWEHMPDQSSDAGSSVIFVYGGEYGYHSNQCNGVYYNPATTYSLPVTSDGVTYYPNASFTAALPDGYKAASASNVAVNLSTSFNIEGRTGVPAYYYSYGGTQTTARQKSYHDSTSTFFKECGSAVGGIGDAVFTKHVISTAAEKQNFANWYSYYRTRMLMMKSSSGLAFKGITNRFRVGYLALNNNTGTNFVNIADFTTANKTIWYNALYGSTPGSGTPLKTVLSKAGRLFGGKLNGSSLYGVTVTDPLQYSCQQNYSIVSTDGYWNNNSGSGPSYKLDGSTAVGDIDGAMIRPYSDGKLFHRTRTSQLQSRVIYPYQRSTSQLQQRTQLPTSQTSQLQSRTIYPYQVTSTSLQQRSLMPSQATSQLQSRTIYPYQVSTSNLQQRSLMPTQSDSQLQSQTVSSQAQTSTSTLQTRSKATAPSILKSTKVSGSWGAYVSVGACTSNSTTRCQFPTSTSTDSGSTWTAWSYLAVDTTCTPDASGASQRACSGTVYTSAWTNATSTCTVSGTAECQYTAWTGFSNTASCSPLAQTGASPYTVLVAKTCNSVPVLGAWTNVGSCTASASLNCQYTAWTAPATVASCTPAAQSAGPTYTVGNAVQCGISATWTAWANVGSCTATASVGCQYTAWSTAVASTTCTAVAKSAGPAYTVGTATQCVASPTYSAWTNVASCNASAILGCQYTAWTAAVAVPSCTAVPQSAGPSYTVGSAVQCGISATWTAWANVGSCTATASVGCQYTAPSAAVASTTCTAVAQSAGPAYTVATAIQCTASPTYSGWSSVASCNTSAILGCQYTAWTAAVTVPSCTAVPQSSGPSYTVATATQCGLSGTWTAYADVSSCTASAAVGCQYTAWSTASAVSACSAVSQSTAPTYTVGTAVQCTASSTYDPWVNTSSCTASSLLGCQYTAWSAWTPIASCTVVAQSTSPNYTVGVATDCDNTTSGGVADTLADVAAYYYITDLRNSASTGADATGTCTGPIIAPATTANDLCQNNVATSGTDVATSQHMTTFTLGLGVRGAMVYQEDYKTATSGDYAAVATGATASSTVCTWNTAGTACTWPIPGQTASGDGKLENVDDLWHAAVNGHGTYFSATDPDSLANSLTSALTTIVNTPTPGTAAAAASSNPNVSASDNFVFSSSYKSVEWYGELIRQRLDEHGVLSSQNWSAMKLLDCATTDWAPSTAYLIGNVYRNSTSCYEVKTAYTSGTTFSGGTGLDGINTVILHVDETAATSALVAATAPTARTIYTKGASGRIDFTWAGLTAEGLTSYFTKPAIAYVSATAGLSQFCAAGPTCLAASLQTNTTVATGGAAGEALVNYLRGDRTNETTYFHTRVHVLGDIVSSEGRYVKVPLFNYADTNYTAFKTLQASRSGTVYVGSNDGMLHAFNADDGTERWGYIPSIVLPDLYKLADMNYSSQHQYYVDSSPEVGDICPNAPTSTCTASQWRTILVGGLNRGGKGYYALDVTDPTNPVVLWEFTNAGLGYTYSNPKITKLADGTWVVMFASGYNNTDGLGRLFVLKASTGVQITAIPSGMSTGVGSAASPSGISRISAHVISPMTDNTTTAVYGGDTLGNLWRFDVNGTIGAAGRDAHLLLTFKDGSGNVQPITVKPLVATINSLPVVFVGTGRYLGTTDVSDTHQQSFYAVKDKLDDTTYSASRGSTSTFVQQTLTDGLCPPEAPATVCVSTQVVRTSSSNPVDWNVKDGWYVDFITTGERASTDPSLALGTILFTTITPQVASVDPCAAGGSSTSFVYALNFLTGSAVTGADGVVAASLGAGIVTRPVMIEQSDGTVRALIRTSSGASSGTDLGGTIIIAPPVAASTGAGTRRVSWRELTTK